ncbi:hypothetical protein ACVXHA_18820 [Escherichia coli]
MANEGFVARAPEAVIAKSVKSWKAMQKRKRS